MSERHSEGIPEEGGSTAAEPETDESPPPSMAPTRPQRAFLRTALWLAGVLILVIAGVALSPFWARDIARLIPWGEQPGNSAENYAALDARLAAVEKRSASPSVDLDEAKSAESALARRIDQLETMVNRRLAEIDKRPASPSIDVDAIRSAESALSRRIDRLEAAPDADRQTEAAVAATRSGLQQLDQQLGAVEAQLASRTVSETAELQRMQQELARLGSATADVVNRLSTVERQVQSQNNATRTDPALALLLLRMREAIEQARPFPAEYSAFKALSRDPNLAAATEPLAEAARNGVATRAVLSKRLAELAGQVASATEPPAESDWRAQALARLRGLVTIRRIDGGPQTGPEAAVSTAETALSRGDLAGAVSALGALSGANAEAVRAWLRMAQERMAVEAALDRLQELLAARLGSTPAAPSAAPASAPDEPSAKTRGPS